MHANRCDNAKDSLQLPVSKLNGIIGTSSFSKYGIESVGLLPIATWQKRCLIVTIDYFSKCQDVEPITRIQEANIKTFVWKNIIFRFKLPKELVIENSKQFTRKVLIKFCTKMGIKLCRSSP